MQRKYRHTIDDTAKSDPIINDILNAIRVAVKNTNNICKLRDKIKEVCEDDSGNN